MATSKTLTPTNVTIQIPEFTDQPDQRVNSNCIDKEADAINALNTQISTLSGSFKIKSANIPYTMSNGNFNTNVKTYIDNELATGEVCLGIVGYTTNSQYVFVASLYYPTSAGNYTCQLGSRDNGSYSGTLSIRFLVYKPV